MEIDAMNNSELLAAQRPAPRAGWRRSLLNCPKTLGLVTFALIIPWLIPGYFSAPVVFDNCWTLQPLVSKVGDSFSITRFETREGSSIPDRGKVCFQGRLNSRMNGTADSIEGTRLRLFQIGSRGEIYIHEPPLEIKNRQWSTSNIGSGSNLREMRFVRVSEGSSAKLSELAKSGDWGPVKLDADAQDVASFGMVPDPVCTKFDARDCTH
jgi:hypothetical protein